jgi:hypothetical protein
MAGGDLLQTEPREEAARVASLLVDLDVLADAHHAELGMARPEPALQLLTIVIHHEQRMSGANLGVADVAEALR